MTRDENEILQDHGERLARIEATLSNHVMHEIADVKRWVARLDSRLWWVMGLILASALATIFTR
jgi:hypothetical protein